MMKTLALVLTVALFPLAADAQAPIPRPLPPGGVPDAGISVIGIAQQHLAVRSVQFLAFARGPADERGVLDAMRGAGIVDASVGAQLGGFGPGSTAVLRGTIPDASKAKLDTIAAAAAAYVRSHPGAAIDNVRFFGDSVDCTKMEQAARVVALAEARRRADAIAAAAKVSVGPVIRVSENGGCQPLMEGPSGPPVDAATLTATLNVSEYVTYEIVSPDGGRRRPL